jgi:tetratricopeptide (TPR) repeat protein
MVFPFDASHIAVRKYHHLGEDIGFGEAVRMKAELQNAIQVIASKPERDSPVYTFFTDLQPPTRKMIVEAVARTAPSPAAGDGTMQENMQTTTQTVSVLMNQAEAAINASNFATAKALLTAVRALAPKDAYVAQKLALATYKSKLPTPLDALREASAILCELKPDISTDTETLGLWGGVHKRLWELTGERANLDAAIFAHEKGFCLKNDYWNGINLAFLYDLRAAASEGTDLIADRVLAERTRRRVLVICETLLKAEAADRPLPDKYWLLATMAEASLGLKETEQSRAYLEKATAMEPKPAAWMLESTQDQLAKLAKLML